MSLVSGAGVHLPLRRQPPNTRVKLRAPVLILSMAAAVPARAEGQQRTLGPTLAWIISGGDGVARSCLQTGYSTGLGVRFVTPFLTRVTTVEVAGRGFGLPQGSTCVDASPAPHGTYIEEDRVNLLSRPFVTSDVRLGLRLGKTPTVVAFGVGNAWHEGYDFPYVLFAGRLPLLNGPGVQFGIELEYQWLRVSGDRYRRTYQNGQLVTEEPLGRIRRWSHAASIGLHLGLPL